jgi:hypothetical protein
VVSSALGHLNAGDAFCRINSGHGGDGEVQQTSHRLQPVPLGRWLVVSPDLPLAFARGAAFGDIVAAILALAALATLRGGAGIALVWAFNVWAVSIFSTRSIRPTQPDYCQGSSAPPISFPQGDRALHSVSPDRAKL